MVLDSSWARPLCSQSFHCINLESAQQLTCFLCKKNITTAMWWPQLFNKIKEKEATFYICLVSVRKPESLSMLFIYSSILFCVVSVVRGTSFCSCCGREVGKRFAQPYFIYWKVVVNCCAYSTAELHPLFPVNSPLKFNSHLTPQHSICAD